MSNAKILYVVIPCYNEQEALPETSRRLKAKMSALIASGKISDQSRVMLVNDGSKDATWQTIADLYARDELFAGVNLTRNRGHQNALLAGLMTAKEYADVTVSMDADLQDDIDAMDRMLEEYDKGCDIVYGVRSARKTDTFFKRFTAEGFYRLMQVLGVEIVFNHADYRLMSRRALQSLSEFSEVNLFLRGIVPQLGYRTAQVMYERHERIAGESKYPLKKMLSFAFDGITSFSVKPIRLVLTLGVVLFTLSMIALLWSLIAKLCGAAVSGWASLMCSIWMLGGIQMISLGVIGEYVGKIYNETKRRPRYLIEQVLKR